MTSAVFADAVSSPLIFINIKIVSSPFNTADTVGILNVLYVALFSGRLVCTPAEISSCF